MEDRYEKYETDEAPVLADLENATPEEPKPEEKAPAEPEPKEEPEHEASQDEDGEEDEHKRKSGYKRLKAKLERAKAEIEQLRNAKPQDAAPIRPESSDSPKLEDFETYEDFSKAFIRKEAERIFHESKAKEEMAKIETSWKKRQNEAEKKYDDFDEVADVQALQRAGLLNPIMAEVIYPSEVGPDLLYWLGSHPEEAREIANMTPGRAASALGRVEERLANVAAGVTKPTTKPTTKAPPPIAPLVGTSSGSAQASDRYSRYETF